MISFLRVQHGNREGGSFTKENSDKHYVSKVVTPTSTVINHADRFALVCDENGNSMQVDTSAIFPLKTHTPVCQMMTKTSDKFQHRGILEYT